jgi:NapC/NirT cytochrome c family, N-terminal region
VVCIAYGRGSQVVRRGILADATMPLAFFQRSRWEPRSGFFRLLVKLHLAIRASQQQAGVSKLLLFKADRGAKDFWNESRKTIATKDEWEKRRPQLRAEFESYLQAHNYITCRGCHTLEAFGGPRSQMKVLIHKDVIKAHDVDCLRCHQNIGHVYEQPMAKVGGWYTTE